MTATAMLNVATKARELRMQPVDLVRELLADGIEVLPVSKRSYRVDGDAYASWRAKRAKCLAEKFAQGERRSDYVRGTGTAKPKRRAKFKR